ncbi:MAG: SufB/SufD family protein [Bacilli bacterium]
MINLFEQKADNIKSLLDKDKITFDINAIDKTNIRIDWKNINLKEVILNIHGENEVKIIEVGEPNGIKITYNLDEYAKLFLCLATFYQGEQANYRITLKNDSFFKGALADFSYGNKEFNFDCELRGQGAYATWNLASLSTKEDIKSFTISFYHYAPHTYAKMENYGVCENESKMYFLGTSSIEKGAKKSSTHQSAKIMVFDPSCKAKASPTLCIDENDVEASHAAVVGQINEDHIFYLMSRGLEEEDAKKLITLGYLNPILNFFDEGEILEEIKQSIEKRM